MVVFGGSVWWWWRCNGCVLVVPSGDVVAVVF